MKVIITEQQLRNIIKDQKKGAILIGGLDDRTDKDGKLIDKTIFKLNGLNMDLSSNFIKNIPKNLLLRF
jgi:hypothetical protein